MASARPGPASQGVPDFAATATPPIRALVRLSRSGRNRGRLTRRTRSWGRRGGRRRTWPIRVAGAEVGW